MVTSLVIAGVMQVLYWARRVLSRHGHLAQGRPGHDGDCPGGQAAFTIFVFGTVIGTLGYRATLVLGGSAWLACTWSTSSAAPRACYSIVVSGLPRRGLRNVNDCRPNLHRTTIAAESGQALRAGRSTPGDRAGHAGRVSRLQPRGDDLGQVHHQQVHGEKFGGCARRIACLPARWPWPPCLMTRCSYPLPHSIAFLPKRPVIEQTDDGFGVFEYVPLFRTIAAGWHAVTLRSNSLGMSWPDPTCRPTAAQPFSGAR